MYQYFRCISSALCVYLMIIKVYGVENCNVFIILRYFHNIVVYFIKSINMWKCLVYHNLIIIQKKYFILGQQGINNSVRLL